MVAILFLLSKNFISPFFRSMGNELNFFLEKFLYSLKLLKSKLISAFCKSILTKFNLLLFDKLYKESFRQKIAGFFKIYEF